MMDILVPIVIVSKELPVDFYALCGMLWLSSLVELILRECQEF